MGAGLRSKQVTSRLAPCLAGLLAVALVGCGGSSKASSSPQVVSAGQIDSGNVDLQLPPGWKMTKSGPVRTTKVTGNAAAAPGATSGTDDTIPLAQEDPTTKFFAAISVFQTCLKGLNVKFVGAPDPSNPNSPANNPDYLKSLGTCAAKSNIVQALKDQQTAQDNLTPAQIETQNKGYLVWRDCMIGRGWGIPTPKPDAKGRLFAFGAGGGSASPNFTPPPGQDILSSADVQQCASESQQKVAPGSGG